MAAHIDGFMANVTCGLSASKTEVTKFTTSTYTGFLVFAVGRESYAHCIALAFCSLATNASDALWVSGDINCVK